MFSMLRGFRYAVCGIAIAIKEERNLRFDICVAAYLYVFSLFYDFSKIEYMILTTLVAGVLALETVNSAFERVVDNPKPERYAMAGVVKDMAAGAVLLFSMGAAVCGLILFWDIDVFKAIATYFINEIWPIGVMVVSLAFSYWFVFLSARQSTRKEFK